MAEVVIAESRDAASALAAEAILNLIRSKPKFSLGVATGDTPLTLYRQLASLASEFGIGLEDLSAFALDEYVGLDPADPRSFHHALHENFVKVLGLDPARLHVPSGSTATLAAAGDAFERSITAAGGIDCQILGIGSNGHIGFNEPGSSLASRTRVTMLAEETRRDNADFFAGLDDVPRHSISQGIGTILEARHLILLAFGAKKASAIAAALEGPVTASCPGSAIQLHPTVTVFLDPESASSLSEKDYYLRAWEYKRKSLSWRLPPQ